MKVDYEIKLSAPYIFDEFYYAGDRDNFESVAQRYTIYYERPIGISA